MAFALDALGKQVRIVNADPAPDHYQGLPRHAPDRDRGRGRRPGADAVIVMECSDLSRTGVAGLEPQFLINIDHHAGNHLYGALNWYDETAAACGEMVFDLIQALGVR
jgi:bifunctional oligoribonuclease and PAP phosphatase NrnA